MFVRYPIEIQLILHEGLRNKPYRCPGGYWTIGVGRNLEIKGLSTGEREFIFGKSDLSKSEVIKRFKSKGITDGQAFYLLKNDVDACREDLENFLWFKKLDPSRQKVLLDMRFNLGATGLRGFKKMIVALESKLYERAAAEMKDSKWFQQVGNRALRLYEMMITGKDYEYK